MKKYAIYIYHKKPESSFIKKSNLSLKEAKEILKTTKNAEIWDDEGNIIQYNKNRDY